MSTFYTHDDKQSGDGLAITDWNELSNAVAGEQGLHLALDDDKVGIGTTNPLHKLQVNGNAMIGELGETLKIGNIGHQSWAGIAHTSRANTFDYALIQHSDGTTILNSKSSQTLHFRQGNGDKMVIKDGDVGIGTTSPSVKLEVIGNVKIGNSNAFKISQGQGNSYDWAISREDGVSSSFLHFRYSNSTGSDETSGTKMSVSANGRVGIGTTSPSDTLHVNGIFRQTHEGNTFRMYQDSQKLIFNLQNTNFGTDKSMSWDGDTNWDSYSDRRLKTNIEEEKNILNRLTQLKVKNFNWKDDPNNKRKMIGFIAQDVQPLFPTLVKENNDESSNEKKLTIPYASFGVLAVGAIKELNEKVEKLTKKVDVLAKKLK